MNSPLFNESVSFGVTGQSDSLMEVNNPWYASDNSTQIHPATILNDAKVPQCFETYFKLTKPNSGDQITVASLSHIIRSSGLPVNVSDQILYSVLGMNQTHINKTEFFVILGLIALAQKNMDVSLENLFNRRHDLPEPHLTGLDQIDFTGLNFPKQNANPNPGSGPNDAFPSDPWRNSTFNSIKSKKAPSTFNSISKKGGTSTLPRTLDLPLPAIDDDEIEVTIAPEMGGTFFKFINYQLVSKVRECTVLRRYSDFYWLDEVLTKRYQSRMIPELPPKKFAGNSQFQKDRLMGLSRYINLLAIHPILKEDSLVNAFLTEPVEMAQYKRENKVHTFEEVEFSSFTSEMADSIPQNLKERVVKARENISQSISQYERICDTFGRLASRQTGAGKDLLMYSQCLETLSQFENWCHNEDCKPCPQLVTQYQDIATYLERISAANIQKSSEKDLSVLESFKRHLTMANSLRNLINRYDQTNEDDQIESLQKLVNELTSKIDLLQSKSGDPSEIDQLNSEFHNNEKTLNNLVKKSQFKKFSIQKELEFYHKRQLLTSNIYQTFVENELEFANLTARLYQQLSGLVETLPTNSNELANMSNDDSGLGGNEFGL